MLFEHVLNAYECLFELFIMFGKHEYVVWARLCLLVVLGVWRDAGKIDEQC